jgi:hypothetical protein
VLPATDFAGSWLHGEPAVPLPQDDVTPLGEAYSNFVHRQCQRHSKRRVDGEDHAVPGTLACPFVHTMLLDKHGNYDASDVGCAGRYHLFAHVHCPDYQRALWLLSAPADHALCKHAWLSRTAERSCRPWCGWRRMSMLRMAEVWVLLVHLRPTDVGRSCGESFRGTTGGCGARVP